MRIVQVVENLEMGGLERIAIDLAIAHKAAGHESRIYCIFDAGVLAEEAQRAGIPVTAFHKPPGFSLNTIIRIAARLRRDRAEVVHTHNPGIHPYGALAGFLARVPAVVNTRHGPANSQGRAYQERHFRAMLPFTGRVVFVSEDSRRFLAGERGPMCRKSRVIWNGIPTEKFTACPAAPGSLRPRLRFGTVGRMAPVKDHRTLLEAFALLAPRLPEAELRIVGGGPLFEELQTQTRRLGLEARVRIEGPNRNVPALLSQLDLFVFSSTSEGLPVSILEAMAAGLPIVSTRVGGIPEVAPEGPVAWYCPPGRPDALADAMYEAAGSPHLSEMGQTARQIATTQFGLAPMQQSYERLFAELLSRRNGALPKRLLRTPV